VYLPKGIMLRHRGIALRHRGDEGYPNHYEKPKEMKICPQFCCSPAGDSFSMQMKEMNRSIFIVEKVIWNVNTGFIARNLKSPKIMPSKQCGKAGDQKNNLPAF
jgi:NADH:ubiquinone oxidoreductase subunit D